MTHRSGIWWIGLREAGPAKQTLFLTLATIAGYGVIGAVAFGLSADAGLFAAAAAAAACWLGAVGGLIVGFPFRALGPQYGGMGFLAGMLPRMGVPLVSLAVLHFHGGPLAESGVIYYGLVFYLVLLGLETAISLPTRGVRPPRPSNTVSNFLREP
ncbi:MAG: hypothetical protein GXY83_38825 [Rhodopirellula sp.]|nr:hypothetical protein [Rhodopirellula sp.]